MVQLISIILFFYVFVMAAIIMTYFVIRAIRAYMRAARKEQEQKDNADAHSL